MLKWLGIMLILYAASMFGFHQAWKLSKRPKQIRAMILSLQRLETEILYGFTPLPDALGSISLQAEEPLSRIFSGAAEAMRGPQSKSTRDGWQNAVNQYWRATQMKDNEKMTVSQLGNTLGLTDREDQVKHLRLAINQLQSEEELAKDDERRYEKMWKSLGVLIGVLVVIVMF